MKLTQRISKQSFFEGLLLLLPTYLIFGGIILSAVFNFVVKQFSLSVSENEINAYYNVIFDLILLIFAVIIFRKELKQQLCDLKQTDKLNLVNELLQGIVILYVASFVGSFISMLFTRSTDVSENQEALELLINQMPFLMILTVVVFAPILEEIIFRLLFFTGVYPKSRWLAYIISAGLFGLLHVYTPILEGDFSEILMVFPYLLMGIGLCLVYEKSDNIFVPMLSHGIINLISFILLLL